VEKSALGFALVLVAAAVSAGCKAPQHTGSNTLLSADACERFFPSICDEKAQVVRQPYRFLAPILSVDFQCNVDRFQSELMDVTATVKNEGPCDSGDNHCDLPIDPNLTVLNIPVSVILTFSVGSGQQLETMTNGCGRSLDDNMSCDVPAGPFSANSGEAVTVEITQVSHAGGGLVLRLGDSTKVVDRSQGLQCVQR